MLKLGIIKEEKTPIDERVPFTPAQCAEIAKTYPCDLLVQSSDLRRIKDEDYLSIGVRIEHDVEDCDVLMGVKEVPIDSLIPGKTYFFFSHTIKEQPYNRKLLQAILDKNIRMIDYECLTDENGMRLLGFGRYAGIVGAYNGFRMIGDKTGNFKIKPAFECKDQQELFSELKKIKSQSLKICLTGRGRVASGAKEILDAMKIQEVNVEEYLGQSFDESVYVQLAVTDYNKRKDGKAPEMFDFFKHPDQYESDFGRFLPQTDFYIACHFWDVHSPNFYSLEDMSKPHFNLKYVADISCDIAGPIASTLRPSTIANPFYSVDKKTGKEVSLYASNSLSVMAVDNLPCELPVDASYDFGAQLLEKIVPALFNEDREGILKRATIAENGQLTKGFKYLEDYLAGKD